MMSDFELPKQRKTGRRGIMENSATGFVHCTCSSSNTVDHALRHANEVAYDGRTKRSFESSVNGGSGSKCTWRKFISPLNTTTVQLTCLLIVLIVSSVASQEGSSPLSTTDPNSQVESISASLRAALSLISQRNLANSSAPTEETVPSTTDVYSRAIKFLDKRDKERRSRMRLNSTIRARPRVTTVRAEGMNERLQVIGTNHNAPNMTKRMDDGLTDQDIQKMTDEVANITLTSAGEGRAANGRSMDGFSSIFSKFTKVLDLGRVVREIETSVMTSVSCTACRAGVGLLFHYVNSGRTNAEIAHAAIKLCVNLKMQSSRVCSGIINLYVDEVVEVLKGVVLSSNEICALVVGESCGSQITPAMTWAVSFPPIPKPPFHGYPEPKDNAPKLKVLQISDTHWDPFYEPGSNAECNEPLCCRITSGPKPPRSHLGAGIWGDYRKCDTPRQTMESMFDHISRAHPDIDYIIWTGDIPAHDVWNQTHSGNLDIIHDTVDMFTQYFPHIPIFPALGNHESVPVNSFAPPWVTDSKFSIDWLYAELEKDWSRWLPETTYRTIKEGAFYSTMISPGFKLISINTNYCNNKNWWLLVNSTDPADELKWLIFELQSSEFAGEKVHIIGHIPPGHADCMATWSRNYYQIVSRYENTIAAQFFGHTHYDELELFYPAEEPYRPSSVAYIGPSVTPYYNLNPGYRIYYVDGDYAGSSRTVVDHETWIADISDANRLRSKVLPWFKLYSAKEAYGMTSLNPGAWDDLIMSMYKNKRLFNMYYRFYNKNSPVAADCDDECKQRLLCDARSGKSHAREELCRPRPVHIRTSRGGLSERPTSRLSQFMDGISSVSSASISVGTKAVRPCKKGLTNIPC